MVETIQNMYKLSGVFRCTHDIHRHFKSELSPFYILSEKNCYPDGCVYFKWKCRLLAKQKTCFRGFSFVGRKCFNCRYFYEEKQHHYPEYIKRDSQFAVFKEKFDEFETWVQDLRNKRALVEGTVSDVIPSLSITPRFAGEKLQANGFLIRFEKGYINNRLFLDNFYLSVSALAQNKLLYRRGDAIEFEASLTIDRGRFKFIKPGNIQFYNRGMDKPIKKADIIVALKTYTKQPGQPKKCLQCKKGVLVDHAGSQNGPSRSVICLEGNVDYQLCHSNNAPKDIEAKESCINMEWHGKSCHHVL